MPWKSAENRPGRIKPSTRRCLLELPTPVPTAKVKKPRPERPERQNRPSSTAVIDCNTWMPVEPQRQHVQVPGPETCRSSSKPRDRQPERSASQRFPPEETQIERRRRVETAPPQSITHGLNTWMLAKPQPHPAQTPDPETSCSSAKPLNREPERIPQELPPERRRCQRRRREDNTAEPVRKTTREETRNPVLSIRLQLPGHQLREFAFSGHKRSRGTSMVAQHITIQAASKTGPENMNLLQGHKNVLQKRQRDADEDSLFEAVYRVLDKIEDRARAVGVKLTPTVKNEGLCSIM